MSVFVHIITFLLQNFIHYILLIFIHRVVVAIAYIINCRRTRWYKVTNTRYTRLQYKWLLHVPLWNFFRRLRRKKAIRRILRARRTKPTMQIIRMTRRGISSVDSSVVDGGRTAELQVSTQYSFLVSLMLRVVSLKINGTEWHTLHI